AKNISDEGQIMVLGYTNKTTHYIDTGSAKPIKQKLYRMPINDQEFVQKEIKKMEELKIIRPAEGPWSSPIVIVPKKNNKKRICIDYRKLNVVTEKDVYLLPNINEILDSFGKAKWFTSL